MTAAPATLSSFRALNWSQRIWQDLQPCPGRLHAALRIVLTTVIALVLMMVLQLPFASLSLYYIFLVARENPATSVRSSVISLITIGLAVVAELGVVIAFDNDPMARLLSVAVAAFIAGTLMAASTLPPLASIWGFIYCTLIAFWERPAPADALVKASLYLIASVGLAALCSSAVEYIFASRNPVVQLAQQLNIRYQALERMFTLFAKGAAPAELAEAITSVNRLAAAGQRSMLELYNDIVAHNLRTRGLPVAVRVRITMLAELMDVAAAFASQHPDGVGPGLRGRCAHIARHCRERAVRDTAASFSMTNPDLLNRVEMVLHTMLAMPEEAAGEQEEELIALPARKIPFLVPGALTSRETAMFALKLTLCAMICYVFYFAVAWPGISTAVTTVFITALSNSGAINQKMTHRLLGSAIGGGLAIGATVFLFPLMDSITSLVILIGLVAFLAAWWAGGRHFGYVGLQIAFSFYLVAFEGFSAPTELAPARDRLVGILVALVVIWVVFDALWPVRTVTAMRRAFASILRNEARFLRIFVSSAGETEAARRARLHQVDGLRDQIGKTIAGLRTMNDSIAYEFGLDRAAHGRASDAILRAALTAVPFFWNQLSVLHHEEDRDFLTEPGLVEMRRRLAIQMDIMAEAVVQVTAFHPVEDADLAEPSLLASPRYGEYVSNTIARYGELQALLAHL